MTQTRQTWRDAVETLTALTRWCESDFGREMLKLRADEVAAEFENEDSASLVRSLYVRADAALGGAAPFFISPDMCDVVAHASESFAPEPIYPTDVLDINGFMYFAKPIQILDRYDRPVFIAAVSWTPCMDAQEMQEPYRPLTRDDEMREWLEDRHARGMVDGLALTLWEPTRESDWREGDSIPPLSPMHVTPWWWGMTFEGNELTAEGRPSGAEWWWRVIQTTWRLMAQHITVRTQAQLPRPLRRERQRLGYPPHDCVVVTLRREAGDRHDPTGEEAHYSHRFIRHGHWRNQPYPKEGVYRQIWIADMIVGPEDKPLIIKPRVYAWTR